MKKILISVLIILLLVLSYFAVAKGIGFLKIKSINDIKNASNNLENEFNEANELSVKTYPSEVDALEEAIKKLKENKQEYENKNIYNTDENLLGAIEIKTYKIHYLWTILGNYRKDRGVQTLTLDLVQSATLKDVYDLQFTLVGEYTRITDFLYDIENDEELNFEIKNFSISSNINNSQTGSTNAQKDTEGKNINVSNQQNNQQNEQTTNNLNGNQNNEDKNKNLLQAKFTVENVGITLD